VLHDQSILNIPLSIYILYFKTPRFVSRLSLFKPFRVAFVSVFRLLLPDFSLIWRSQITYRRRRFVSLIRCFSHASLSYSESHSITSWSDFGLKRARDLSCVPRRGLVECRPSRRLRLSGPPQASIDYLHITIPSRLPFPSGQHQRLLLAIIYIKIGL
jgi:hypothetical protein